MRAQPIRVAHISRWSSWSELHCRCSCAKPAVGLTLEFSQLGHVVVTTKTGTDGSYRVGLPKGGRYVISVRGHGAVAPTIKPSSKRVVGGLSQLVV